jgi:hypothetical protein
MFKLGKLWRILVLMVLALGFNLSAQAQEDCIYGYAIYVRDEAGKVIGNGKLEVSALTVPMPGNVSSYIDREAIYNIIGSMGSTIKGDFLFRISAEGFEPYERRFKFPVCDIQRYELRLLQKGSTAKARYERLFILHGKVFDEDMKALGDAKVEAKSAEGRVYQTSSNQYGYYEIGLPQGVANIRISSSKFPDIVFDNYKMDKNYSVLNVPVCLKCNQKQSPK